MEPDKSKGGDPRLAWCMNVFPASSLADLEELIDGAAKRIQRAAASKGCDPALGLWLPASLVTALQSSDSRLNGLKSLIEDNRLKVATTNCFPFGSFHGETVKKRVYTPDWAQRERLDYTLNAFDVISRLVERGSTVPVSTLPLGLDKWGSDQYIQARSNLLETAKKAAILEEETGVELVLCLEPEPGCLLGSAGDFFDFYSNELIPMAENQGIEAECRRYIGLCLDTCHCSVVGEDPVEVLFQAKTNSVKVGKVQLSSALRLDPITPEGIEALEPFDEPIYCHQTSLFREAGLDSRFFMDLKEAIEVVKDSPPGKWSSLCSHFHVPLFWEGANDLTGTAGKDLPRLLSRADILPGVLEVETYTWSVLPDGVSGKGIEAGIASELDWALTLLNN